MEYKNYEVVRDSDVRYFVVKAMKGKLPNKLSGKFTNEEFAKVCIDRYIEENVYAKARTE